MRLRNRHGQLILFGCAALLAPACDATFIDGRPESRRAEDAGRSSDGPTVDTGSNDSSTAGDGAAGTSGVFAMGEFEGRAGYTGRGMASLRRSGGRVFLEFSSDFEASAVPAPVVVLSSRQALGTAIDGEGGDIDLGTLKSLTGEQSYEIPAGEAEGRRYAWIYCKPFAVEVARALMEELP
jgi:hypothetical protein